MRSLMRIRIILRLRASRSSLWATRQHSSIPIIGIGNSKSAQTRGVTTIQLRSNYSTRGVIITAHILTKLTSTLPLIQVHSQEWPHISSLQLADPEFVTPRPVDIIIGADSYGLIIQPDIKRCSEFLLIAQSTIFGWIVLGPIPATYTSPSCSHHTVVESSTKELHKNFSHSSGSKRKQPQQLTTEEEACENHFKTTHTRDEDGRYMVRIPLNSPPSRLGDSKLTAQRCLKRLMKKLSKNDSYTKLYNSFMKEYEELGHMQRAPHHQDSTHPDESAHDNRDTVMTFAHDASASGGLRVSEERLSGQADAHPPYYLPHHDVLREDRITTKLRIVFNVSSPTTSRVSLNDIQHVGAKIQRDISDILIWIRQHKYIFSTDITKMYR